MAASKEEIRKIVMLLNRGRSSAEIADIVGVSRPTVWAVKANWTQGKYGFGSGTEVKTAKTDDPADETKPKVARVLTTGTSKPPGHTDDRRPVFVASQIRRRPILHYGRDRRFGIRGAPWALRDEHRDEYCLMLAALRRGEEQAIRYFFYRLNRELSANVVIALVPCHLPGLQSLGLGGLGRALAVAGRTDATTCLVRKEAVPTLDAVFERGFDLQRASIALSDSRAIRDRAVLLLDDLAFTGNSIRACEEALYEAGAADVQCVVLGRADPAQVLARPQRSTVSPLAGEPSTTQERRPDAAQQVPTSRLPAPRPRTSPRRRHEHTGDLQPEGAGPDYSLSRRFTRPLIVDSAPGPKYEEMLRRFGAIGDVD